MALATLACGEGETPVSLPTPTAPPPPASLSVTGIVPERGPPGTVAAIRGNGFRLRSRIEVTFKGTFAAVVAVTDTLLTVSVPDMPDGRARVVVTTPERRNDTSGFTFFTVLKGGAAPDRSLGGRAQFSTSCPASAVAALCSAPLDRARER